MKLTASQIKYIDDYLKHHKVKYWDIRIELLDHIVTTIENKMEQGTSFDDAMIEVHRGFGNKMNMYWNTGVEYSIFANGSGFKKLIDTKIQNASKNYFRILKKELITSLKTVKTLLLFITLSIFYFFLFEKLSSKNFISAVMFSGLFPFIYTSYISLKYYYKKEKAISVERSFSLFGVTSVILYQIHFLRLFDVSIEVISFIYLIMAIVLIPIIYASFKAVFFIVERLQNVYTKLISE